MMVKDEFLAQQLEAQPNHKYRIRRVAGLDGIKTTCEEDPQREYELPEKGANILRDVPE